MSTTTLERVLDIGRREIGSHGRPNKYIAWYASPKGLTGAWLTAPWCAMWASWVLKRAGIQDAQAWAYCPSWVNHFKAAKRWGAEPRIGAIVFFDWNKDREADHVGIVTAVGKTSIKALEGNTRVGDHRNRVAEQTRAKSTVLGYGYPDYGAAVPAQTYVVRSGDSLTKIAGLYGVDWRSLYRTNKRSVGPDPDLVQVGTVLTIP